MTLEVDKIDCGYGSVRVLKSVTLQVRPGATARARRRR
jgi:ABC-type branched-subunit amino acid transport system ATPase component